MKSKSMNCPLISLKDKLMKHLQNLLPQLDLLFKVTSNVNQLSIELFI